MKLLQRHIVLCWLCCCIVTFLLGYSDNHCSAEGISHQDSDKAGVIKLAGTKPVFPYVPYDIPPEPVGGYAAIQRNLVYPVIARTAGVEGTVMVRVVIGENGDVEYTDIVQTLGNNGCDEAAMKAIKSVKWKPALARDKPVRVTITVPVVFRLKK